MKAIKEMKTALLALGIAVCVIGCGQGQHSQMDTHADLKDIKNTTRPEEDDVVHMPGGIGVTAGQTGTGTTSG
jgi:hypothetical protein